MVEVRVRVRSVRCDAMKCEPVRRGEASRLDAAVNRN
jgi:hypothetical protein